MFALSPLPRTLPAALRDLRHKKFEVRLSAVRDLGQLAQGEDRAAVLDALVRALGSDDAAGVRAEAAVALADAKATETTAQLLAASDDEHLYVRQMALVALGEVAPPEDQRVHTVLAEALEDAAAEIRYQAIVALARLYPDDVEPMIVKMLSDRDEHIRYVTIRIAEERWCVAAKSEPNLPVAFAEAALEALRDTSPQVRLAAAILLARAGNHSGVGEIALALNAARKIRDLEDEQAAVELAGKLKLVEARPGLERRAWGLLGVSRDAFAWHSRVALATMGDDRAKTAILRGLSAWTRDARSLAVAAAGEAHLEAAKSLILAMRGDKYRADQQAVENALERLGANN